MSETWRLLPEILDPPNPMSGGMEAAYNMAVDEAVSLAFMEGDSPPTVRLYAWRREAMTMGYFQAVETLVNFSACEARGISVVRRITGGGAVLHGRDLSYSIIGSGRSGCYADPSFAASFKAHSRAWIRTLSALGLEAAVHESRVPAGRAVSCFSAPSRFEILVGGRKVIGSAQRRWRGGFLQQGSVSLGHDPHSLPELLNYPENQLNSAGAGLNEFSGRPVSPAELRQALIGGFRDALGVTLSMEPLSAREAERACELAWNKYGSPRWNLGRSLTRSSVDNFRKEARIY